MIENLSEAEGVLVVNKSAGFTSFDVVGKMRKLYGTRKVGHTGTLDPMATGVLVVLFGRAAKAAEYLVSDEKIYRAGLKLGITTDTEDTSGKILTSSDDIPTSDRVKEVCAGFVGEIWQVPPMYSAIKIGGQKLVDLARQGKTVEREARKINIFLLEVTKTEKKDEYILDVHCSSGTYIRTLCADIGKALGCGGAMSSLERRKTGNFEISESHTEKEIEDMSMDERLSLLIPTETLFSDLPAVNLEPFYERLCRSGCEIYQKKIRTDFAFGTRVRMCDKAGNFFALGEVKDFPDGSAIKAIKMFDIK